MGWVAAVSCEGWQFGLALANPMDTLPHASSIISSPWGKIFLEASDRGICRLEFLPSSDDDQFPSDKNASPVPTDFPSWSEAISDYLRGRSTHVDVPLDLVGTPFQLAVWRGLQSIPPGCTMTYGAVAKKIGHPGAVRAVASACARNRVAILIPCHRVIRRDGNLAGYRWGLDRKRALLDHDHRVLAGFVNP